MKAVGLIAGSGRLPLLFIESAKRAGFRVIVAAHVGEAEPSIEASADAVTWVHLGQLGKIVDCFRAAGVHEAAMAGGIRKSRLWSGLRPDLLTLKSLPRFRSLNDDGLLRTVADVFETEGVRIVDPLRFCPDLLAREGAYTRRTISGASRTDVELGREAARLLGQLDIGQTVCVKDSAIIAVEAAEGTDACLRRAGALVGAGITVVKVAKPQQDMRFDVPCVGPETIAVLQEIGAVALAIEAGRTLVLDEAQLVARAEAAKVAVLGIA